jgi:hypothetical protein
LVDLSTPAGTSAAAPPSVGAAPRAAAHGGARPVASALQTGDTRKRKEAPPPLAQVTRVDPARQAHGGVGACVGVAGGAGGRAAKLQRCGAAAAAGDGALFSIASTSAADDVRLVEATLAKRSVHADDAMAEQRVRFDARAETLEKKEALAVRMEATCSKTFDASYCSTCSRVLEDAHRAGCEAKGHALSRRKVTKYAFRCGKCSRRQDQYDAPVMTKQCETCGERGKWAPTSVFGVSTVAKKSEDEVLLARGVEQKFIKS